MSPISDIVKLSKLETVLHCDPDYTQHFECPDGDCSERRPVRTEERWKRKRRLGQGGYGTVYLEQCFQGNNMGKLRAVKEIPKKGSGDYNRELEAIALLSTIKHQQCFVKFSGWYEDENDIFLAMEYFPLGDLYQHLGSPLPEVESRQIVTQILEAIHFMHDYGFTHRDLKPQNVLIASKGPDWWVKITDFGISKRAMDGQTALRTRTGTPAFMAPEILFGGSDRSYTSAVDIWSLSVMTFLMLTGQSLFANPERLQQYVAGRYAFPSEILLENQVTPEASDFLRRLMNAEPDERPTVGECRQLSWFSLSMEGTASQRCRFLAAPSQSENMGLDSSGANTLDTPPSSRWSTQDSGSTPRSDPSHLGIGETPTTRIQKVKTSIPVSSALDRWSQKYELRGEWQPIQAVAYCPHGERLACGTQSGFVEVWDPITGKLVRGWEGHTSWAKNIAYSPDGNHIASGSYKETIKIWDAMTGEELNTLRGHSGTIYAVAYSPNGEQLASGASDRTIKIWDAVTGRELNTLQRNRGSVFAVAYSPDGNHIASGTVDGILKIWDSVTGKTLNTLQTYSSVVRAIAYSPNGKQIASGSLDHTIKIWDSVTGRELNTLKGHSDNIDTIAYSPDGKQIASGSRDHTIKIWDSTISTDRPLQSLENHSGFIKSIAYAPNRKEIASASSDETLRIWDTTPRETESLVEGFKYMFQ